MSTRQTFLWFVFYLPGRLLGRVRLLKRLGRRTAENRAVAGILIAEYWILRRARLDLADL